MVLGVCINNIESGAFVSNMRSNGVRAKFEDICRGRGAVRGVRYGQAGGDFFRDARSHRVKAVASMNDDIEVAFKRQID